MKATNATGKVGFNLKHLLYILAILLFVLLFSKLKAAGINSILERPAYAELSSRIIESNLQDCAHKLVYLEGIELLSTPQIYNFYKINGFKPAWTRQNELTSQSEALITLFESSYSYGIEPALFNIQELKHYQDMLKDDDTEHTLRARAGFEFLMTNSAFTFMLHLLKGNEYATQHDIFLNNSDALRDFPKKLKDMASSPDIIREMLAFQPENAAYRSCQHEMELVVHYIDLLEHQGSKKEFERDKEDYKGIFTYLLKEKNMTRQGNPADLLKIIQHELELRETGKLSFATSSAISGELRSRYAELAYKIEMIRKKN